jgi:hypothetical protein
VKWWFWICPLFSISSNNNGNGVTAAVQILSFRAALVRVLRTGVKSFIGSFWILNPDLKDG